ncbi:MAG: protein translocase subunit SecF [Alphaproteobacteria bacterium]|nr:protein translocase subunit SecF [Alphaproteobacteria bacterium]
MRGIRLVPEESNINFIGLRVLAYMVSFAIILGSIGLTANQGLNFGIDFTGGTLIEIKTPETPDLTAMRNRLNNLQLGTISIQEFGEKNDLLIRFPEQQAVMNDDVEEGDPNTLAIEKVSAEINNIFEGKTVTYRRVEFVGPQVGEELKQQGLWAIIFSLAGILAYIWMRFEWQFGVAAVVALAHDSIATIGLFALTQMEFNLSTVAAILMIAGYSINDTVVVFDRIRENLRKYKKKPLNELFNFSVNQTLGRTLMTSLTTLLALVALYYFGGEVIRGFVYALIFGIVIGTYSSIFVASPVLMMMNIKRPDMEGPSGE